jgi:multisubunit Na+/H+ antiporter MnhC subunit
MGALRQRLVLTAEEKRVIVFVLLAFLLGLSARHYRDTHSSPPTKIDKKTLHTRGARK